MLIITLTHLSVTSSASLFAPPPSESSATVGARLLEALAEILGLKVNSSSVDSLPAAEDLTLPLPTSPWEPPPPMDTDLRRLLPLLRTVLLVRRREGLMRPWWMAASRMALLAGASVGGLVASSCSL